ncbi:unnamed protein product [Arabis nemorensis]|uniref:UV radiation resistance-associated gene protein n=1 Tax=Arabis nemorensis TaxID=586526 RepID=A0A565AKR3_9BRAS|nr:unnamed protein product [Arabis nemorensis]
MERLRRIDKDVKKIKWEDFENELTRILSLYSALEEANERKRNLQQKLEPLIQVNAETLSRRNELEEMRQRLEARKLLVEKTSAASKVAEHDAKKKEEKLSTEVKALVIGGTSLSVTKSKSQDSNCQLEGERDYARLNSVMNKLRKRQQNMISLVSRIYHLKIKAGLSEDQKLESFPGGSKSGTTPVTEGGSVTILGLPFSMAPFAKMSFFTDKEEAQRSATALGYVAHAVSLIASYLTVPLRYPLRFGGSKSYIRDFAPSIEPLSSDMTPIATLSENLTFVEFPLFLDGQDSTRAAYAVFLLNKNIEQLLNIVGKTTRGSRQLLQNLKELTQIIQSPMFLET